jgi:hypothetical protein
LLKTRKILLAGLATQTRYLHICAFIALLFAALLMPTADAVDVPTLYTAQVLFDEEADNPREDAYKTALIAVLARVSGSQMSSNEAAVDELFPVPAAYVTQFRPGVDDTLWVSFDDEAIDRILKTSGKTLWGHDRPLTLVWLAVDWGNGIREIIAAGDPERTEGQGRSIDRNQLLRERVLEVAQQRGLPLAFPLLDTTDMQSVTFSDIWGGFDGRVAEASTRYDASSVLIGRVRPLSSQRNRWTYRFGAESRSWTGEAEQVVSQIADLLAAEFAVGGGAPPEMLALNVSGIKSVDAYGSVQEMLAGISLVENVSITSASGDTVYYQIEARGGVERLRRALLVAGLVESQTRPTNHDSLDLRTLDFFYGAKESNAVHVP